METRIHYEERTSWAWWAHLAIALTLVAAVIPLLELAQGKVWGEEGAMSVPEALLSLGLGIGLPSAIYLFFGQLRVRVRDTGIDAAWGFSEAIRKNIPFEEIGSAEAVTYSPLGDFGGWGIRTGRGKKRAWTVQGNRAVRLDLRDGSAFYVGSARPERLLSWIQSIAKGRVDFGLREKGRDEKSPGDAESS